MGCSLSGIMLPCAGSALLLAPADYPRKVRELMQIGFYPVR